jgi:adenosylmethionine-8-amino-7-oxononanoate aminotransferase
MWGVEFVKDRSTKKPFEREQNFAGRVAKACAERGVRVYPVQGCVDGYRGDHIMIAPPATVAAEEIDEGVGQMIAAVRDSL